MLVVSCPPPDGNRAVEGLIVAADVQGAGTQIGQHEGGLLVPINPQ
jgi:hypothetical protein